MKTIIRAFLLVAIFIISLPIFIFAQDVGSGTPVVIPDFIVNYFGSLAALVPLVVLITGWINKATDHFLTKWMKIGLSWVISFILVFIAWKVKIGMFAEVSSWYIILLYGICTGLVANGFFSIGLIQTILGYFKLAKPKKK